MPCSGIAAPTLHRSRWPRIGAASPKPAALKTRRGDQLPQLDVDVALLAKASFHEMLAALYSRAIFEPAQNELRYGRRWLRSACP
jgi:hypothetical protein